MIQKPSKEVLIKESWFRGNLKFKLHEGQKIIKTALENSKSQLFVANCSRQWGKSYLMASECVSKAIKNPKSKIKYGTAFLTDLTEFIIPTFEKILEDCPQEIKPKYKTQGSKFVFPNGSEIKLIGLDKNPNGLRGNTIDLIVIDECGFVENLDYLYRSVIVPATTHRPNCKIIFISTPPSTPAHSFLDYVQKAEAEGSYCKFDIFSNPLINEETIERLKKESGGENSTTWKREYLCEFVTDQDLKIIPEWNSTNADSFVKESSRNELYNYYHKYVGMDLGVKDFTACIFGYYDFLNAKLVIEDEFTMNGPSMTTEKLKNEILKKESELWGEAKPFRRISDNNNPLLLQDLGSLHGLHFISTDKDTLEVMINELRLLINRGGLEINPRCKQLIGCLSYGVWDKSKKSFARSGVYGHYDHLAALIYLVRNLDQRTNPIPATHGVSIHTHHIPAIKEQTKTKQAIKSLFKPPGS